MSTGFEALLSADGRYFLTTPVVSPRVRNGRIFGPNAIGKLSTAYDPMYTQAVLAQLRSLSTKQRCFKPAQWSSSLLSLQSFIPSHSQTDGIQTALSQMNSLLAHTVGMYNSGQNHVIIRKPYTEY